MHASIHGEFGRTEAKAGDSESGAWSAFVPLEDTVFTSLTCVNQDFVSGAIGDYTYPKGVPQYGKFTAFDVSSGSVTFYKCNPG